MDEKTENIINELNEISAQIVKSKIAISNAETEAYMTRNKLSNLLKKQKTVMRDLHLALGYFQS